ncbi:hypothetical protein COBT_002647 [Conglomerata obtusa]
MMFIIASISCSVISNPIIQTNLSLPNSSIANYQTYVSPTIINAENNDTSDFIIKGIETYEAKLKNMSDDSYKDLKSNESGTTGNLSFIRKFLKRSSKIKPNSETNLLNLDEKRNRVEAENQIKPVRESLAEIKHAITSESDMNANRTFLELENNGGSKQKSKTGTNRADQALGFSDYIDTKISERIERSIEEPKYDQQLEYVFNETEESNLPINKQCMPIRNDNLTISILNKKLEDTLNTLKYIEDCDYVDFILEGEPNILVRVVERQCNDHEDAIICSGLIKGNAIIDNVRCLLESTDLIGMIPKNPLIEDYIYMPKDSPHDLCQNKKKIVQHKKLDIEDDNQVIDISLTDHIIDSKGEKPNLSQILIYTNMFEALKQYINGFSDSAKTINPSSIAAINHTGKINIIINEQNVASKFFNHDLREIEYIIGKNSSYCLINYGCNCNVKSIETYLHNTLDLTDFFETDNKPAGLNKTPYCITRSKCICSNTGNIFKIYNTELNKTDEMHLMCKNFTKLHPAYDYTNNRITEKECSYTFNNMAQSNSLQAAQPFDKIVYTLISALVCLRNYFVNNLQQN